MNRLSFLKTIGVGIAAAVITPKILTEIKPQEELKEIPKDVGWCKKWAEEIYQHWKQCKPFLNDICIDKDGRQWLCTALGYGMIELTAFTSEPEPNFVEVKEENFNEYFFVLANLFVAGTGEPKSQRR